MNVKELIEILSEMNPLAKVQAWDADTDEYEEVTGVTFGLEPMGWVCIQTDVDIEGDPARQSMASDSSPDNRNSGLGPQGETDGEEKQSRGSRIASFGRGRFRLDSDRPR